MKKIKKKTKLEKIIKKAIGFGTAGLSVLSGASVERKIPTLNE